MGLADYFSKDAKVRRTRERALKKLTNMYYQSGDRLDAAQSAAQLVREGDIDSVAVMLARFEHITPNYTMDQQEKEYVFDLLVDLGVGVAPAVAAYARTSKASPHWALKVLARFWSAEQLQAFLLELLRAMSNDYWRSPERKVSILHLAAEQQSPEIAQELVRFVEDHHEEARIQAIEGIFRNGVVSACEALMKQLEVEESTRIQRLVLERLAEARWPVAAWSTVLQPRLGWEYTFTPDGALARR
jgi:hypothetical protein